MSFSPNGKLLASGSYDHTIRLWHVETGELQKTLEGHRDHVTSVSFSPNGELLASGSYDHTIRLWHVETGELQKTLEGHRDHVTSVSFSPNGELLASGSYDHTIRLWHVETGELQKTLEGHRDHVTSVSFSPNGELLASKNGKTIQVWKGNTQLTNLNTFSEILSLAWKQNLTNGEAYLATGHLDASVRYWRITQVKNAPCFELLWSSVKRAMLNVEDTNIEGVQELSLLNAQLLAQRGAKGKPNMLQSLTTAAEQGNVNAKAELGKLFLEGKEVTQDLTRAIHLFSQAIKQKHPSAMFYLGICYEEGKGVPKDSKIAREWYTKAAKLGSKEAQEKLETSAQRLQSLFDTAQQWYTKVAKSWNKNESVKLEVLAAEQAETCADTQSQTTTTTIGLSAVGFFAQTQQVPKETEAAVKESKIEIEDAMLIGEHNIPGGQLT